MIKSIIGTIEKSETTMKQTENETELTACQELPQLILHRSRSLSDFEVESIQLEAKGTTINEAMAGMQFLLEQLAALPHDTKHNTTKNDMAQ